jgi:hypothetical protein
VIKTNFKKYSLKRILNCLRFNRRCRRVVKNRIFEIPYNKNQVKILTIPNIQNKTFKVSKWFVKVGSFIEKNQVICELESNSITLEFESLLSGKLVSITTSKEKLHAENEICKIEVF